MRIGLDIDGVLMDDDEFVLAHTTKYAFENNIQDTFKNLSAFTYQKLIWDENIIDDYRQTYLWDYYKNDKPRKFANEVIKKIRKKGHEIIILTTRWTATEDTSNGKRVRDITLKWLKQNDIEYDDIIFTKGDKSKECIEYKIDLIIDDSPRVIEEAKNIVKYVFCYDNRYNIDIKDENIIRVFSWYDIYNKIEGLEK
jgi:Uncharacterized conserved protein